MRNMRLSAAAWIGLGLSLMITACGGGGSIPNPTNYVLTVDSTNPASGVKITVGNPDNNVVSQGTTSFTETYSSGTTALLTAPTTAGGNNFSSWSGCTSTNGPTCTVTVNANMTVTANFTTPVKTTPTVTVTPNSSSVTTAQALTVTVSVSGGSGDPTPTGTVTLTSGSYTSAATTLAGTPSSAPIAIPAGSLAMGSDTLTVTYTPDTASSSVYNSATGTGSVTITAAPKITPTVNVTPSAPSITATQTLNVTVAVSAPSGDAAPTGTVTLTSGTYMSSVSTLSSGSATISVAAGSLATGTDTLTVTYSPDPASSSTYNSATGTSSVTVTKITPTVTVSPASSSITATQALTVTITLSGGGTNPTPTGSVTLTSGSYTSTSTTLSSGSATINIAAGTLATGTDTLTATYTPDTASSSTYNGATGTNTVTVTGPTTYVLTVDSASPASGIDISAVPSDNNGNGYGPTPLTFAYNAGTSVSLSAPATSGGYAFVSWTGCASSTNTGSCSVTMNANTTVTATYNQPSIQSITVTPSAATIGTQVQFKATVNGTGNYSSGVTWSLTCSSCGSLSPGTMSSSGLYTTPYPAPASVTVTATSTQSGFTNISGSVTVMLSSPATVAGPALSVDASNQTHAISPYIYGMNNYSLDSSVASGANITIDRFGGDATSRYNYLLDDTSSASDYFFENQPGSSGAPNTSQFNSQVTSDASVGAKTLGTVDVLGWVAKDGISCSFPISLYPGQQSVDTYRSNCGNGVYATTGENVTGNSPTLTSIAEGPSFAGDWVTFLVSKFGTAADGGVFAYDLDNEPAWWDAVHRDVHPIASTYDEVTNNGIATAEQIKTADPTAAVNGPVVDYWWNYFYSKKDIENGWGTGPCYQQWDGPIDRTAHGGVPFIEYYLQQFAAASNTYGSRLLDYLDMHTYFAAEYDGKGVGLTTAGDTGEQIARVNSTRVFWDPTYTDPNYPQPNYTTDSNYTSSCSTPLQAPQLIPMMESWTAKDYPGTKTAITEYNWGGQENINGAVAQADILGIFGSYGLDLGTLWGPPNPTTQLPGLLAFEIYRNYDGKKSTFGDTALGSTSANQGTLSIYGAVHTSGAANGTITIVVINKTYGSLTSTLSLANLSASATTAQPYLYSEANLSAIVAQPAVTVTAPAKGSTTSTISNYTFPAQSITLFVVPQ